MTQEDFQKKLAKLKQDGFQDAVIHLRQTSRHRVHIYTIRAREGQVTYRDIHMSFSQQIHMGYDEIVDLKGIQ